MVADARVMRPEWLSQLKPFGQADRGKAVAQLFTSLGPYAVAWAAMIITVKLGWPAIVTFGLAVVAAGFLIRIFIIFHDCCHGSFFASRGANRFWGYVTGILTLTPFDVWRQSHARHHATAGDLDRRGTGDVFTMTVAEYRAATPLRRLGYRLYRNPLVMFGLGAAGSFIISQRFAPKGADKRLRSSVAITNLALLAILVISWVTVGWGTYVVLQVAVSWIAGILGIWLFYMQHQFEDVYWSRHEDWDRLRAALEGSSYYKLPKLLRWFSGNIGFHHIHHLRSSIPNYNLQACYEAIPEVQEVNHLTLRTSLRCLGLALWDEEAGKLVRFREVRPA